MKWTAPDIASATKPFEDELAPLYKQQGALQKKMGTIVKKRQAVVEELNQKALNTLPKDYKRYTPEQWAWVLNTGHHEATCHHTHKRELLETTLGLSTSGFHEETLQPAISIFPYPFEKEGGLEKMLKSLSIVLPHMKPVTVEDSRHGKETGIRLCFYEIQEDTTSVAYIHKGGDVVLYPSRWSDPVKFKDLTALIEWYAKKLKNKVEGKNNEW